MNNRTARPTIMFMVLAWSLGAIPAQASIKPPTEERDLVVLIARYKPSLYRLVGQQPTPFGTAQFYSPQAIVADPAQKCFYVFDEPKLANETRKVWRIEADGTAKVVFQAHSTANAGPFSTPTSLGLARDGRPLIADTGTGLWRLETDGRLQRLFDGKDKPLYRISAATDSRWGLVLATSYLYAITGGQILNLPRERDASWSPTPSYSGLFTRDLAIVPLGRTGVGNSTGRQVPIRIWKNQGGLYLVDPQERKPEVRNLMVNQKPGGEEYDTYWRAATQVFVDAAGRAVLVDAGSVWKRTELVYTGSTRRTKHPQTRKTKSVINGGIFVLYPDGRFEDLTFKTPNQSSGPMRRPHGAAQWSDDTYLVADPEMHVEGITGTGGLLLLNLDGARQARWPFGERLRPLGVAILRDAGPPAQATPTRRIRLADLAGTRMAGRITRVTSASWQRKPAGGGGMMGPVGLNWENQPSQQAEAKLRSLFENARWSIAPDGTLRFAANGVNPQTQGTPLVMQGTVTAHAETISVSARYKTQSMFDTQLGSLDARLYGTEPHAVKIDMTITVFTKTERLKGAFEQTMSLQSN